MRTFLVALQFLTCVNLVKDLQIKEQELKQSSYYFPLVGLIIGGLLSLLAYGSHFFFQPLTLAVFVVAGEILLTGGLHLDGFMDSCDGLFSGRERARMLEIMKDSRVGAMGIIGILLLLSLKVVLLLELPFVILLRVLIVMPVLGRWAIVYTMFQYPYARAEGLGALFQNKSGRGLFLASLYSILLIWAVLPLELLLSLPFTAIMALLLSMRINQALQGHTGDTYGMVNEMTEVFFLFWCALLSK